MSDDKKNKNKFIVCPVCEGSGINKYNSACSNCSGMGTGMFFHGKFFYWGPKLGRAVIELDHLRKKFHLGLNIVTYLVSLAGLLSLAFWVYKASNSYTVVEDFFIWRIKDPLLLLFWIGLATGLFVFYRISGDTTFKQKIKIFTYEERNRTTNIPNNWEELKNAKRKFKYDVSKGYTEKTITIVENAYLLARNLEHKYVTPLHLFYSSLEDEQVAAIFSRLDVPGDRLIEMIKSQIMKYDQGHEKCRFSRTLKEVLVESYIGAHNLGQKKISAKNLIIPCLEKNSVLREVLYDLEIDKQKVFNVLLWFIINEKQVENYRIYRKKAGFKPGTNMDRAYTSVATPLLNQLGYDLTVAAKWGKLEYCVARENEIEKIFQIFESGLSGVILTGQVGVGKKAIIDGVAQLMVKEDVPDILKDKRLVELDSARLISGVTPAQAQGRMVAIIDEIARAGNIVLYINNIENIIGISSGVEESLDLSGVLASALERKELYCLATATIQNYIKYIEGKTLGNAMSKIDVIEPLGNQAIQIIESKIGQLEGKYKVYFSYNAIEQVIKLSSKYIHDKYLPEKAIYILELVAVKVNKKKGDQAVVGREDIAEVLSDLTNIPITKISQSESQQLLNLEDKIHKRMISQEVAVKMVADSLRRARADLREGKRPIANFLFLGPTGVGKTELAKTVAEIYFGEETHMIRLDMSEYQHPDSIKKMIGDAQGAVGYLTESVRQAPFSLILLDELEKAHADILNIFLQVMDDGRLTDGQGRTIDFTNSIIIATSNAGALYIQEEIFKGTDIEEIKSVLINEYLNKVMRPELINRFDGVIVFEPLSMENVVEIAKLMLKKIEAVLLAKGINFNASEEGIRLLAKEGYDPKFGARPLRRIIQDKIENSIANKILANELKRRDTVIIDSQANVIIEKGRKL